MWKMKNTTAYHRRWGGFSRKINIYDKMAAQIKYKNLKYNVSYSLTHVLPHTKDIDCLLIGTKREGTEAWNQRENSLGMKKDEGRKST